MLRAFIRVFLFLAVVSYPLERLGTVGTEVFIFSLAKLFTVVLAGLAVLHAFVFGRSPTARRDPKLPWVLAFFFSLGVSTLYALWMGIGLDAATRVTISHLSILGLYLILTQLLATRRDLDILLVGWVVGCAVSALSAVFLPSETIWQPDRRAGVGGGSNENAGNLLLALAIAYSLFTAGASGWKRLLVIAPGTLHLTGFLLAASRSAFLGAVGMGGLWALRFRRARDARNLAMLVLVVMAAVSFAPQSYFERIASLGDVTDRRARSQDVQERLEREGGAVVAFVTNPIIGVGSERFVYWSADNGYPVNSVHNAILKVAAEQGLFGLIPYLALLTLTWLHLTQAWRVAHRYRNDPEMRVLSMRAVMIQIGFVGLFAVAMFQPGTLWKGMWVVTATSTAILALVRIRATELGVEEVEPRDATLVSPYVQSA